MVDTFKKGLLVLSLAFITVFFANASIEPVAALGCKYYPATQICGFKDWDKNPKPCSQGDNGASKLCCWWRPNKPNCGAGNSAPCGNCYYVCGGSNPPNNPPNPTPTPCSCNPVACPPGSPATKFATQAVGQGTGRDCSNACNPQTINCSPKHVNVAPSCSILPGKIVTTREATPKQFQISVTDRDYGDSVEVVSVIVKDTAGNLNSCIKVTNLGGGSLLGPIKSGSNNPAAITQVTSFLVDAREAHGIFGNVNGQSICSGSLEIEIVDVDSDGPGGQDSSAGPVKCSIDVEVTNEAPQLSSVKIFDRDENATLRESGNLIDGVRSDIFVGSSVTTSTKSRASYCKEAMTKDLPVKCPVGGEEYFMSRRNPLLLEFTVSDANGSSDIMQAGVWLQLQTGANPDAVAANNTANIPPTSPNPNPTERLSFQAMYSEKESNAVGGKFYFMSRGCLSPACGPMSLATSSKQVFTGLGFIAATGQMGPYAGNGAKVGNLLNGQQRVATVSEWHQKGFPDCLLAGGCSAANVPTTASVVANSDVTLRSNYAWAVGANDSTMLCYPSNAIVPKVIQVSTPVVCPANCAACIKREGAEATSNPNEMTFRFGIYFNDKEATPVGGVNPQGLTPGKYAIFVSALDKVGVPLYSITGKTHEGWTRFDKFGKVCRSAACGAGTNFSLLYDPIAPTLNFDKWTYTADQLDKITASAKVSDNTGGSGVGGSTNRYILRAETLDGEPLGIYAWANKANGSAFNGSCDVGIDCVVSYTGGDLKMEGYGLVQDESITAGACLYDKAGNMSCAKNNSDYVFLSAWLKTTYGDIFSSKGTDSPFSQTLPTNTDLGGGIINNDNTRGALAPYTEQIFTAGTGLLMSTSTTGLGISGGHIVGAGVSQALGFKSGTTNFYRDGATASPYTVYGFTPFLIGNEYGRARAAAILNCDLINEGDDVLDKCQTNGSLASIGQAEFNILNTGTASIDSPLLCTGVNVIFVSGVLTVRADVTKANKSSGCMFVLSNGSSLVIEDIPSNATRLPDSDGKTKPHVDKFEGAIVAETGATVSVKKPTTQAANKSTDRLEITGWVYSASTVPNFLRNLAAVDNRRYPAEIILYDATLLDLFRPLLGAEKTVDLTCGTSEHVLCTTVK